MSAAPATSALVAEDPDLLPTRRAEASHAFDLLSPGHAVVIVGHPGEGRSTVTREAFRLMDRPAPAALRCHRRTTAAQVLAWFEENLPSGVGLLEDVDALPNELADLLEDLLQDQRMTLLLTADAVAMRSEPDYDAVSTVGVLNDLWRRRFLGRIDLSALPTVEILARIRQLLPPSTLDALQETALVHTASGSLALARDLAEGVMASPEDAPRLLPRAWGTGYRLSSRTLHRVAARFRDLPADVREAAVLVYQVGPLGYTTAARVLGPDLVNRMEACGVAHASGTDDDALLVVTSVVASGLLSDPRMGSLQAHRERLLAALLRLWHTGVPLGDATALVLARWLLDEEKQDDPRLAGLFLQAAAKAARHSWSSEAESFAELASAHGLAHETRPLQWHTLMLEGRHAEVLAQAEAVLTATPEAFDEAHVYRASIASGWLPSTPEWLLEHLRGPVAASDPAFALVTRILLGDIESTPEVLEDLERLAFDPGTSLGARLWSLTMCITRHLSAGALVPLQRCISAGRALRGRARSASLTASAIERDARLLFDVACCAAQVTAGLDATGVERIAVDRTFDAVAIGPASGRFSAANACYLQAVLAYHRGDTAAARLNIASAMRLLDRTSFSSTNAYMAVFSLELTADPITGVVDPEALGEHLALTQPGQTRVTSSVRSLAEAIASSETPTQPSPRPAWAVLGRVHHTVLAGQVEPARGLAMLSEQELNLSFPAGIATVKHLRALAEQDADGLVAAAEELRQVGKLSAARHALTQARLHFLSHRQTARANDCAERLNELPLPENPTATATTVIPAGLTQREYEICQLVAEGLTNVLIGERLFLSVRTVESHVLQARAKLRAPRRRDIPERLARIAQGRA